MERTYWNNKGTYQSLATQLQKLIPSEGAVENPRGGNRQLEKFRQASNAYYDIFNNGGGNRGPLIRRIFGISVGAFRYGRGSTRHTNWDGIHCRIEPTMDDIVLDAAVEQGLITSSQANMMGFAQDIKSKHSVAEVQELIGFLAA